LKTTLTSDDRARLEDFMNSLPYEMESVEAGPQMGTGE
jgi:hypothetical protein